jgi:hypothetical protein
MFNQSLSLCARLFSYLSQNQSVLYYLKVRPKGHEKLAILGEIKAGTNGVGFSSNKASKRSEMEARIGNILL